MFFERKKAGTGSKECKWGCCHTICLLGFKTAVLQAIAVFRAGQGMRETCKKIVSTKNGLHVCMGWYTLGTH